MDTSWEIVEIEDTCVEADELNTMEFAWCGFGCAGGGTVTEN
jgi:hypothetical protein